MKPGWTSALVLAGSLLCGAAGVGAAPLELCAETLVIEGEAEPVVLIGETGMEVSVTAIGPWSLIKVSSEGHYQLSDGSIVRIDCSFYMVM